ncbi:hypothetical protein GCM10010415_08450 [Streptomyces atrovirens]
MELGKPRGSGRAFHVPATTDKRFPHFEWRRGHPSQGPYARKAGTSRFRPSWFLREGPASPVSQTVPADSCAGRLSMKELTENTALPGPGGP